MSTPLPLAGELADDLLMAPMRSAHICSGERMPSARRGVHHLVSEPLRKTGYRFSGSER